MKIENQVVCRRTYVMDWCTTVKKGSRLRVLRYNNIAAQLLIDGKIPTWIPMSDIREFFDGWTEEREDKT